MQQTVTRALVKNQTVIRKKHAALTAPSLAVLKAKLVLTQTQHSNAQTASQDSHAVLTVLQKLQQCAQTVLHKLLYNLTPANS